MGLLGSIGSAIGGVAKTASNILGSPAVSNLAPYVQSGLSFLGTQEQNELNREILEDQQKFSQVEARKGRRWSAGQAELSREFSSAEAAVARDWSHGEGQIARRYGRAEAGRARAYGSREARKARQFNRNMSNTQMQRRVRDLRKAGLNPLLALGGPGPASSPASPSPTSGGASVGAPGASAASAGAPGAPGAGMAATPRMENELSQMMSSAMGVKRNVEDIKIAKQTQRNMRTAEKSTEADVWLKKAQTLSTEFGGSKLKWESERAKIEANTARHQERIKAMEEERMREYGSSATGQNLFSLEQMIRRFMNEVTP